MAEAGDELWNGVISYVEGQPFPPHAVGPIVDGALSLEDSEQQYWAASLLAYAEAYEPALTLLREAVERGYCSYPFVLTDPLFEGLRDDPTSHADFTAILESARACHERFLAYVDGQPVSRKGWHLDEQLLPKTRLRGAALVL